MADLYHISIVPKPGVTQEQVEEKLNLAVDWYRYRDGCYVLETTGDENKWQTRLQPLVDPSGYLFICKFDISHYHGFMGEDFWEWMQKKIK